jgi:hypothetical protein
MYTNTPPRHCRPWVQQSPMLGNTSKHVLEGSRVSTNHWPFTWLLDRAWATSFSQRPRSSAPCIVAHVLLLRVWINLVLRTSNFKEAHLLLLLYDELNHWLSCIYIWLCSIWHVLFLPKKRWGLVAYVMPSILSKKKNGFLDKDKYTMS